MIKFKILKAEDYCDSVRDGTHDSPQKTDSGYKLITSKHIKEYGLDLDSAYCISEKDFNKVNERSAVNINDILYSMIGTIGLMYRVKSQPNYAIKNMGLFKISDEIKSKWLYYYLKSPKMQNYIKSLLNGSTQQYITLSNLRQIPIEIPENEGDMKKIIKVLDLIDKKIQINTKTNDNLYKMMKIKFEDWITNLNKYEVSSLSKIANYTNGLAMQKFRPKDNEESLPVIKIKEMNDGITENTERCSINIKDEVIINNGDVLFAWSGTLCMSIWGKGKAGLNQHIFKVTSDKYPKWFYYFWTLKHLNKFKMIAAGKATTMGHIKRGELDISEVLIPEDKELQEMHKIMQPLFNKYINNLIQNETLTQLRDTLLPKLMNGEIDLDKIEN